MKSSGKMQESYSNALLTLHQGFLSVAVGVNYSFLNRQGVKSTKKIKNPCNTSKHRFGSAMANHF